MHAGSNPSRLLLIVGSFRSGVKFRFKKDILAAKSGVFRDMFEVGEAGEGVDEVPVTEPGEALRSILSFCRDGQRFDWTEPSELPWSVIKSLDKYDVSPSSLALAPVRR